MQPYYCLFDNFVGVLNFIHRTVHSYDKLISIATWLNCVKFLLNFVIFIYSCLRNNEFALSVQLYNIVMYRPTLRRKLPNQQSTLQQPIFQLYGKKTQLESENKNRFHTFSIPTKLVSPPINSKKQPVHFISPLLVQSHAYPPQVKKQLNTIDQKDYSNRGIGAYRQINWFYKDKSIVFWLNDSTKISEIQLEEQVNCMAVGQLREKCIPAKLKKNYLVAVGSKDKLLIYSLNPFTLESKYEGVKFHIQNSLQVSKIKFILDNKILVGGCTGSIQLIQIGNIQQRRRIKFPFYQKFIPIVMRCNKINFKQFLYTPKRIFALLHQISPKSWVQKQWDALYNNNDSDTNQNTYIKVYDIKQTHLQQSKTINSKEIQKKLKSTVPNWNKVSEIKSIYIDNTNDKDGQLGIITNDGCFLVIKNNYESNYISKEPIFIPKTEEIGCCEFLQQKKLDPLKSTAEQLRKKDSELVSCSLGYQNLTLISDGLFWIGDQRIDGILLTDPKAELIEKNEQSYLNLVEQNRQWGLYTFNDNYYTIKQQPLRSFVGLLIYIRGSLNNEYEGFHYKQQKFNQFIDKQIKKLKPQRFLRYLIEIIILKERGITVNDFMIELIDHQMKEQKTRDFKQWNHLVSKNIKKRELLLTQDMFKFIWSLILELQYKQTIPTDIQDVSFSSSKVYWLAMHSIYYSLVSPLLDLDHLAFKNNKRQVQQTYLLLKSLQKFIQKKELFQEAIRSHPNLSQDKQRSFKETESTDGSDTLIIDMSGITTEARNIVLSKLFDQKYNLLEEKIKTAISCTSVLMSIYFNLQGFIELNGFDIFRLEITSFKQVLISKDSQKKLKRLIVARTPFDSLQDLKNRLPFFYIEQDLAFRRCINKINQDKKPVKDIDLKQLGYSIYSQYFEDVDVIFGDRMDLKFKMLEHYHQKIKQQEIKLAEDFSQYSKNKARRSIFPDDEEQLRKHKRNYFQKQISLIFEEQKKCIKNAIERHNKQKQKNKYAYSFVMDQIIISISGNIVLLNYMSVQLKNVSLVKQFNQIEKIKQLYYIGHRRGEIKDPFHREVIQQDLFPNRKEF